MGTERITPDVIESVSLGALAYSAREEYAFDRHVSDLNNRDG